MTAIRSAANFVLSTGGAGFGAAVGATVFGAPVAAAGTVHSTFRGLQESFLELPKKPGKPETGDIPLDSLAKLGLAPEDVKKAMGPEDENDHGRVPLTRALLHLAGVVLNADITLQNVDGKDVLHLVEKPKDGQVLPENATKTDEAMANVQAFLNSGLGRTTVCGLTGAAIGGLLLCPTGWPLLGALAMEYGLTGAAGGAAMGVGGAVAVNIGKRAAVWSLATLVFAAIGAVAGGAVGARLVHINPEPPLRKIAQLPESVQQILRESGALTLPNGLPVKHIGVLPKDVREFLKDNEYRIQRDGELLSWDERELRDLVRTVGGLPQDVKDTLAPLNLDDGARVKQLPRSIAHKIEVIAHFYIDDGERVPDFYLDELRDLVDRQVGKERHPTAAEQSDVGVAAPITLSNEEFLEHLFDETKELDPRVKLTPEQEEIVKDALV